MIINTYTIVTFPYVRKYNITRIPMRRRRVSSFNLRESVCVPASPRRRRVKQYYQCSADIISHVSRLDSSFLRVSLSRRLSSDFRPRTMPAHTPDPLIIFKYEHLFNAVSLCGVIAPAPPRHDTYYYY